MFANTSNRRRSFLPRRGGSRAARSRPWTSSTICATTRRSISRWISVQGTSSCCTTTRSCTRAPISRTGPSPSGIVTFSGCGWRRPRRGRFRRCTRRATAVSRQGNGAESCSRAQISRFRSRRNDDERCCAPRPWLLPNQNNVYCFDEHTDRIPLFHAKVREGVQRHDGGDIDRTVDTNLDLAHKGTFFYFRDFSDNVVSCSVFHAALQRRNALEITGDQGTTLRIDAGWPGSLTSLPVLVTLVPSTLRMEMSSSM